MSVEHTHVTYADLVQFMEEQTKIVLNPRYAPRAEDPKQHTDRRNSKPTPPRSVNNVSATQEYCSYCKSGSHSLKDCQRLKKLSRDDRSSFLRRQGRCYKCLERGHLAKDCPVSVGRKSEPATGSPEQRKSSQPSNTETQKSTVDTAPELLVSRRVGAGRGESIAKLAVLPVRLRSLDNGVEITTNALLDNGAGVSFVTDSLAKKLGLRGQEVKVKLNTILQDSSTYARKIRNLEVKGMQPKSDWIRLHDVFTHKTVAVNEWEVPKKIDLAKYPRLDGIDFKEVNAPVELLLGATEPEVMKPLEIVSTNENGPYAMRTRIGWTLLGPVQEECSNFSHSVHRTTIEELNRNLESHFAREFDDGAAGEEIQLSKEEEHFMSKLQASTEYSEKQRYEVGVPLKDTLPPIPDSRPMAKKRLQGVLKRIAHDQDFGREYHEQINSLKEKGYIESVPEEELQVTSRWYLPHHGVKNSNRSSKLRIVFDGSAQQNGISLNDLLVKGPDMTNRLDGVLLRFRENPVAVSSDIQSMFHQIKIPPEDRNWYRFLWIDESGEVKDMRWTVHPFGSKPSPAVACHVLSLGLTEQAKEDETEICRAARETFYVDDHLDSYQDVPDASKAVKIVDETCRRSGFLLRKWASNYPEILSSIQEENRAGTRSEVDLSREPESELPTLGMKWLPESDKLTYRPPEMKAVNTRRDLVSIMTKLFDPLGLVSPWALKCRMIAQSLCKLKMGWDDPLPEDLLKEWTKWREGTKAVTQIEFDRCVTSKKPQKEVKYQMHVFSDASETGHGAVGYIRTETADNIESKLIYARARVNPVKGETIPRAELVAATLAAKTKVKLQRELRLPLERCINWTDSQIVLEYLRNDHIKTPVFVRNRVRTIQKLTALEDWRHVPGRENPADIASRGGTAKELEGDLWQHGPEFLKLPETSWPQSPKEPAESSVHRIQVQQSCQTDMGVDTTVTVLNRISEFGKILRFVKVMKSVKKRPDTSLAEVQTQARLTVIKVIQRKYYSDELEKLRQNRPISKSSSIFKLCPEVDNSGILRVGGRLNDSTLPHESKHPIILPGREGLVRKLVRSTHCTEGHVGRNHIVSKLREQYWITGVTTAVKKVLKECTICKKYQARMQTQRMGSLPRDRVSAKRAFENSGVDYFGPLYVAVGRREEKRYGVLFSCNYTRAIHLEVARRMDTQSSLLAISRFVNRRGRPKILRSDNGTNLIGAHKELREGLRNMNADMEKQLAKDEIEWRFNPPQASHFGGHWERQIRSVRKILYGLVNKNRLTDEELETVMVKTEWIMNSRPLTASATDDPGVVAITPNHLMGITAVEADMSIAGEGDEYRSRWKRVNFVTYCLWKQFHNQYVCSLQERQKWQDTKPDLQKGDIVVVKDDSVGRAYWPIGRIIEVHPSRDGRIRSCKVRTQKGDYTRPITKMARLFSTQE